MSLADSILAIQALAPKSPGHLIRAEDWNALIASLGEYGATLTSHAAALAALQTKVTELEGDLAQVKTDVSSLETRVDTLSPLLQNYLVKLSCERQSYASGEICEITALVTDLDGNPLQAPFPWLDFVAAWGRLRAKAGFTTRAGAGDNSLSVQVNAQGVARVELRAEHSEGISPAEEAEVSAVLETQVQGTGMKISQVILGTSSPSDPQAKGAYKQLHEEYDRTDKGAMRKYTDTYFVRTPEYSLYPVGVVTPGTWRDNRATVIALAKPDADPTTADGARGAASIQVTFRDWLGPWTVDYLDDLVLLKDDLFKEYTAVFQGAGPLDKFREKVDIALGEKGVVGRRKYLNAAEGALDLVNPGPDPLKQKTKQQLEKGLGAQKASEIYASSQGGAVLSAHVEQSKGTEAVAGDVTQIGARLDETSVLQQTVNVLEGRMQATEKVGQQIHTSLTLINDNVRAINPLDENSLKGSVNKISADIQFLKNLMPGG